MRGERLLVMAALSLGLWLAIVLIADRALR